jgi:hypothetical protein
MRHSVRLCPSEDDCRIDAFMFKDVIWFFDLLGGKGRVEEKY